MGVEEDNKDRLAVAVLIIKLAPSQEVAIQLHRTAMLIGSSKEHIWKNFDL